jgi:hypothetical protein
MHMKMPCLVLALGLLTFGAHAQHDHSGKDAHPPTRKVSHSTPPVFQKQLSDVFQANVALKEAFVSASDAGVKNAIGAVRQSLSKVDMNLLKGKAHTEWMGYLKTMNTSLDGMIKASSLDEGRTGFALFSEALYQSIKAYGLGGGTAYYQYCPMALNNRGGHWLSDRTEIRNPYYGAKMLKCGETKETLQ